MAILYFIIAIIFILILFFAFIHIRLYLNPLRTLPGEPLIVLRGSLIENFSNKDFSYLQYYQQARKKYGTIRRHSLPLGRIGLEISDPEWAKVSTQIFEKNS